MPTVTTDPPINEVVSIGGVPIHTSWLGGTTSLGWRFGVTGPDPSNRRHVAPPGAATLTQVVTRMQQNDWEFIGGNSLDFQGLGHPTYDSNWANPNPSMGSVKQYAGLAYLTDSYVGNMDPRFADQRILAVFYGNEQETLADVIYGSLQYAGNGGTALVITIDGSGSFRDFSEPIDMLTELASRGVPSHCKLVVTMFSDYPNYGGNFGDQPAVLVGTWNGINPTVVSQVQTALANTYSGNGGDGPETMLDGAWLGMQQVSDSAYPSRKFVVAYSDTTTVIPFGDAVIALGRLKVRVSENESSPSEWKFANPKPGENNGRGRLKVKRKNGWVNASGTPGL